MKKITFLLFLALVTLTTTTFAQVSSYAFSSSLGTYQVTSASATTLPLVKADDYLSPVQNIGFTVVYDGINYTQFKMSSNGFISLGAANILSLASNDFSIGNPTARPIIAPLWDDLDGANPAGSNASYEVTGTAPNRVLTVEWRNWEWDYASTSAVLSFQVKIYETTGVIQFVYRQEATGISNGSASIGIGSAFGSGAGSFLNVSSVAVPTASSTVSTTSISTKPATGQTYTFTPPTCPAVSSIVASSITLSGVSLNWTSGGAETSWQYYVLPSNAPAPTNASNTGTVVTAKPLSVTGLSQGTSYIAYVRAACSATDTSAWSQSASFTTPATCPVPTTIVMSAVGPTIATANWTSGGSETQWQYYILPSTASAPTTASTTGTLISAKPLNLTGLAAATSYKLYISAYCSATDSSVWLASSAFTTLEVCPAPTAMVMSAITQTTASATWTNGFAETQWEYYLLPSTSAAPTAASNAGTLISLKPVSLSGLIANTSYKLHVRAACSASSTSTWLSGPVFKTLCASVTLPYFQDFETVLIPALPDCTTNVNAGTGNNWVTVAAPGSGFTSKTLRYTYSFSAAANTWFFTQAISLTAGQSIDLSFRYGANSTATYIEKLKVAYGTSAAPAAMTNQVVDLPNIVNFAPLKSTTTFIAPTAGVYYFGFNAYSAVNQNSLYVDDIKIITTPTCPAPTALTSLAITSTGASIQFTEPAVSPANGYDYIVTTTATVPAETATPSGAVFLGLNNFDVTGLLSNTTYYVWARSKCAANDIGPWSDATSFLTNCANVTAFTQNFDAATTLPSCWKKLGTNGSALIETFLPSSAPNTLAMYSPGATTRAVVTMPPVSNISAGTHRLRFQARSNGVLGGKIEVGYVTDYFNDASFVAVQTVTTTSLTVYDGFIIEMGTIPVAGSFLAFRNPATPVASVLIDNVIWEPIPACSEPTTLTASALAATSTVISYVEPIVPAASGYQYIISTTNVTPSDTATLTGSTAVGLSSFTATGLLPSTQYYAFVRSNCGSGSVSPWSYSVAFTTTCLPISTLPWTEGFEGITLATNTSSVTLFPQCWKKENGDWASSNTTFRNTAKTGSKYIRDSWTATNEFMWTPGFQLTAGTSYDFSYFAQGDGGTGWNVDVFQNTQQTSVGAVQVGGTFTPAGTGTFAIQPYNLVKNSYTPTASGIYYFAVRVNQPSGVPYFIAFDDFGLMISPPCNNPNVPTSASVTTTTANISWNSTSTGNSYAYFVSTTNVDPIATATPTGTTAANVITAALTGLQPATTYYVWVKSLCVGGTSSAWSQPGNFTTLCAPVAIPTTLQNFDATTGTSLPPCWSNLQITGTNNWKGFAPGAFGDITTTNSGTRIAFKDYSDSDALLFSQSISYVGVTVPTRVNVFLHRHMSGAVTDLYKIYVNTAQSLTGALLIDTVYSKGATAPAVTATGFYNYFFTVPASFNGQADVYIIIEGITGSSFNSYALGVDDFKVEITPSCQQAVALVSSAVTSSGATVSWTAPSPAPANGYQYFVSTADTAPTAANTPTGITAAGITTVSLTGLNPVTKYYVWVKSICSSTDSSAWSTATNFTTLCAPITPPYNQDFEVQPLVCFSVANAGTVASGPSGLGSSIWFQDGFLNAGFAGAMSVNLYANNRTAWLITPAVNLSGGSYKLTFDYAVTTYATTTPSAMGSDDSIKVLSSVDGGTTWTQISQFTAASNVSNGTNAYSYVIPSTSNNVKFALLASDGAVDDLEDYDFFIDNLKVDVALSNASFNANSFSFYPNPVKDVLTLSYDTEIQKVSVFNLLGQEVITKSINANLGQIDMSALSEGTYLVKVTADNATKTIKVIKQQ